jgi:hypothetical protein
MNNIERVKRIITPRHQLYIYLYILYNYIRNVLHLTEILLRRKRFLWIYAQNAHTEI